MKTYTDRRCSSCGADLDRVLMTDEALHKRFCTTRLSTPRDAEVEMHRYALTPSKSYRWAVLAFNRASGIDTSKTVRWYKTRKGALAFGSDRYGPGHHLIGRAPL